MSIQVNDSQVAKDQRSAAHVQNLKFDEVQIASALYASFNPMEHKFIPVKVNTSNGIVQLGEQNLWTNIRTRKDFESSFTAVRAFQRVLRIDEPPTGHLLLVTQRDEKNKYSRVNRRNGEYRLPPFEVLCNGRSPGLQKFENAGPLVVFTANKAQSERSGSNRVDVWSGSPSGLIRTYQLVTQTYDDGLSFRDIPEVHGEWVAYRLQVPSPYEPTAKHEIFMRSDLQSLMSRLILIPSDNYPGFDQKAELLLIPAFREFLERNLENFPVWDGEERNRDYRLHLELGLPERIAGIKLWDKTRAGGLGIAERRNESGGVDAFQFGVRSFSPEFTNYDQYGLPDIRRGDLIQWLSEYDILADKQARRMQIPLVGDVEVIFESTN